MSDGKAPQEEFDHPTAHLLRQVQAGETMSSHAWAAMLERCESRLRILIGFRLGPKTRGTLEADDLLQEVWIEAARHIKNFENRGPGSLQRWLAVILHHKIMHAGRKAARLPFPESVVSGSNVEQESLFHGLARTQPGVSHNLQRKESERIVRDALAELSENHRESILLKVYEGLNGREAADRLGLSESGFSKRFREALDTLGRRLRMN